MTAPERVWLFTSPRSDKYLQHGTWHTLQNETAPAYVPAKRLAEAEAEVARLRAALEQIVSEFGATPHGHRAAQIARAALAGG